MRLSDFPSLNVPGMIRVSNILINGVRYELGDDGDTLIEQPEAAVDITTYSDDRRVLLDPKTNELVDGGAR